MPQGPPKAEEVTSTVASGGTAAMGVTFTEQSDRACACMSSRDFTFATDAESHHGLGLPPGMRRSSAPALVPVGDRA